MKDRIQNFLNRVNFMERQFGFTKGKSTETALNFFINGILNDINNKNKSHF